MILVCKKKTILKILVLVAIVAVLGVLVGVDGLVPAAASPKKLPIYCVEGGTNSVALTFDAAWGADKTRDIMDILDKEGYKATFFLVGFWVDENPELVTEIHERGHLIGNHSTSHPHMNKLNKKQVAEEMLETAKKVEALVGYSPKYFRAPFGEYNNRLIDYASSVGVQVVQWDVDTLDWKGLSGGEIAKRVANRTKDGSIILCHNNADHIVEALPLMLTSLKAQGLKPVRLDELVIEHNYTIDVDGTQKRNK